MRPDNAWSARGIIMLDRPATERTMMSLEAIRAEEAGDPRQARPACSPKCPTIFSAWTWVTETALAGWACRIRTGESARELSDWNSVTTSPEVGASWAAGDPSRSSCMIRICSSDGGRRVHPAGGGGRDHLAGPGGIGRLHCGAGECEVEFGPGGTGVASRPYRDFTQSKFTPQLAAANNGVVYLQKGEGPQSRSVAGHLTTAVRLPRARSHMAVGRWRHDIVLSGRLCAGARGNRRSRAILVSGADDCARDRDGG